MIQSVGVGTSASGNLKRAPYSLFCPCRCGAEKGSGHDVDTRTTEWYTAENSIWLSEFTAPQLNTRLIITYNWTSS